jgi:dCMP deaminase
MIEWEEIWMNLAVSISKKSKDEKYKVGSVIVTCDNETVLSLGYNGDEKGGNNTRDSMETGKSGWIHAEINAMIKLNYLDTRKRKIYLTHFPCRTCCRAIINANISEVIFLNDYESNSGEGILRKANIKFWKFTLSKER